MREATRPRNGRLGPSREVVVRLQKIKYRDSFIIGRISKQPLEERGNPPDNEAVSVSFMPSEHPGRAIFNSGGERARFARRRTAASACSSLTGVFGRLSRERTAFSFVAPSFCFHFCDAVSRLSVLDAFFNLAQLQLISQTSELKDQDICPHLLSKRLLTRFYR